MNKNKKALRLVAVCFLLVSVIFILISDFKVYIAAPLAIADILLIYFAFRKQSKNEN